MDTRAALLDSENVVVGKSAESELLARITSDDPDEMMPPEGDRLTAKQVATLKVWIDQGLSWEKGFTFRKRTWKAPIKPRKVALPPGDPKTNPIDRIVAAYLKEKKVAPPPTIDDAQFSRRVHLDLIGLLPGKNAVASNRVRLVDSLLGDDRGYANHWMTFWNDILRNDYAGTGYIDGGRKQISKWLYVALMSNKPYDAMVRELIDANGETEGFIRGIKWRGNVNASQVREVQFAQSISQVFLGENMKCASCHDSFINDWKLVDAYGLAAIIADNPLEMHRCDKPTGKKAVPKFLFPEVGDVSPEAPKQERLKQTAALMTSPENGRLARTMVNRIWQRFMGRGLVEPVDIMGNRPWSEDLLDYLAMRFAEDGYDLKKLMRLIVTSRTYQSRCVPPHEGPEEDFVFKGPVAKRMTAEQFIDAVWTLTQTGPQKPDAPVSVPRRSPEAELNATFIWNDGDIGKPKSGDQVIFWKTFELPEAPGRAVAVITCDDEYQIFVNNKKVGEDKDWQSVEVYDVTKALKKGRNTIRVIGRNGGTGLSPAGLFCVLKIDVGGKSTMIGTGNDWEWEAGLVRKPAVAIPNGPWMARVGDQIDGHLATPSKNAIKPAVRASLVKSTMLMRALGRPNREQIVTTRPAELSTLQALELNNGPEFVGMLEKGAKRALAEGITVEELYRSLMQRDPTPDEERLANEIVGSPPTGQGMADLLWMLLMLPEFQIIN